MTLTKIGSVAIRLANKNVLLRRLTIHKTKPDSRCEASRPMSTTNKSSDDIDTPIKFSASEAATWKAKYSRTGREREDVLWYQPYVVMASTAIFLIYFCILREENDVDEKLTLNLTDHFHGEQKKNLEASFRIPTEYVANRQVSK